MNHSKMMGFTLLELMIGLAIVGILSAVAMPVYQEQLRKVRRDAVKMQLLSLHIDQQAYRLQNPSFASGQALGLPNSDHYQFSIANVTSQTFLLTAKATGTQKQDKGCASLTIDQSMFRQPEACW
ncbi:type IV pilin protein [Alteromonas sp. AMM-1]|uniref:type IV pilin protein n=1 Tax=Alteromonas sp. AMM-1 TaxID=3394233 RepID=UPI0039A48E81